jgi:hypothetical protein
MLYFFLWERGLFLENILPALAASWRQRSFAPCQALCRELLPSAIKFSERYCLGGDQLLLPRVAERSPFERHSWRCLVGEILMIGAAEIPEIETAPDSLCCILAPECYRDECTPRQYFAPIQQVHFGTCDLVFGCAFYRPEHAGWNDCPDVERLAAYLAGIDPESWTAADLDLHREVVDDPERVEELEYLQNWFPVLRDLYQNAAAKGLVVICETIS